MNAPVGATTTPVMEGRELVNVDGAHVMYYPGFFAKSAADAYLAALESGLPWAVREIWYIDRFVAQPRETLWIATRGMSYLYTGLLLEPHPWDEVTLAVRAAVEEFAGVAFGGCLANRYRVRADSKHDYVGPHRDDEEEAGRRPMVASVSFGASRRFLMHFRANEHPDVEVVLEHGSLLVMTGTTQELIVHSLPKAKMPAPRINLTFRERMYLGSRIGPLGAALASANRRRVPARPPTPSLTDPEFLVERDRRDLREWIELFEPRGLPGENVASDGLRVPTRSEINVVKRRRRAEGLVPLPADWEGLVS